KLSHSGSQQLRGFDNPVGELVHWNPEEPVEAGGAKGYGEVPESALPKRVGRAKGLRPLNSHRRGRDDLASTGIQQVATRDIGKVEDEEVRRTGGQRPYPVRLQTYQVTQFKVADVVLEEG